MNVTRPIGHDSRDTTSAKNLSGVFVVDGKFACLAGCIDTRFSNRAWSISRLNIFQQSFGTSFEREEEEKNKVQKLDQSWNDSFTFVFLTNRNRSVQKYRLMNFYWDETCSMIVAITHTRGDVDYNRRIFKQPFANHCVYEESWIILTRGCIFYGDTVRY